MAVYDAFMFFNEFDLLSVRLAEHNPFVDYFILVQADRTHSGTEKELLFSKEDPRFQDYAHKIIVVNAKLDPNPKSAWDNESAQRQAIFSATSFHSEDIVYLSDVDEIISRKHWPYLLERMKGELLVGVWLKMFYYFVNLELVDHPWAMAKLLKAKVFLENEISGNEIRCSPAAVITPFPCGGHFSYLMSVEQIIEKIKAYGHQENNTKEFTEPRKIQSALLKREDIFGRNLKFKRVPIDSDWPALMLSDPKWKSFILTTSPWASISQFFLKLENFGLRVLKTIVKPGAKRLRLIKGSPDSYDSFGSDVFELLMKSRPKSQTVEEWRRLIEYLCFVLLKVEGWFSARQCAELFLKILNSCKSPSAIVEVGSWKGRSSVFASRAAAVSNSKLYCVDTWLGSNVENESHPTVEQAKIENVFAQFKKNISLFGCDNVVICRGDSIEVAKNWDQGPIDFLFIDASHDYESVLKDLRAWVPLVKPGGVICGDDWNREERPDLKGSVRKAFEDFFKSTAPNLGIVERFWAHQI